MFDILGRLLKTSNINNEEFILDVPWYHNKIYIIKRGDIMRKDIKN
jgi:hypothetical protein